MTTIAILINSLHSGGAEKQSALLAKVLSRQYNIIYIVFDGTNINQNFLEILKKGNDINVIFLNGGKVSVFFQLIKIFKEYKPEFSFSYLTLGNFLNGLAGYLSNVKNRIGGIRNSEVGRLKFLFERFSHNKFLKYSISNNQAGLIWHKEGGFKKDIFYIPNCFPVEVEPFERNLKSKNITILSVGRFVEQKNYDLALMSLRLCIDELSVKGYNIFYKIIGYGILEGEIRAQIESLNLKKNVEICVDPKNINAHYKSADIYLCTSKFEGMSNSIMEAMSFNLPIVATDVGDNSQLVQKNGFLTTQDADDISYALNSLIQDEQLRSIFGKNSYTFLVENFSEDAFLNKYKSIIELCK